MGTRSLTVFVEGESEIAVLYRQMDGYPSVQGAVLAEYLTGARIGNGITLGAKDKGRFFNGVNDLAVRLICALKDHPSSRAGQDAGWDYPGSFYLYPAKTRDCGEEFVYYISGKPDTNTLTIKCYEVVGGYDDKPREERELFSGTPARMLRWIASEAKKKVS